MGKDQLKRAIVFVTIDDEKWLQRRYRRLEIAEELIDICKRHTETSQRKVGPMKSVRYSNNAGVGLAISTVLSWRSLMFLNREFGGSQATYFIVKWARLIRQDADQLLSPPPPGDGGHNLRTAEKCGHFSASMKRLAPCPNGHPPTFAPKNPRPPYRQGARS